MKANTFNTQQINLVYCKHKWASLKILLLVVCFSFSQYLLGQVPKKGIFIGASVNKSPSILNNSSLKSSTSAIAIKNENSINTELGIKYKLFGLKGMYCFSQTNPTSTFNRNTGDSLLRTIANLSDNEISKSVILNSSAKGQFWGISPELYIGKYPFYIKPYIAMLMGNYNNLYSSYQYYNADSLPKLIDIHTASINSKIQQQKLGIDLEYFINRTMSISLGAYMQNSKYTTTQKFIKDSSFLLANQGAYKYTTLNTAQSISNLGINAGIKYYIGKKPKSKANNNIVENFKPVKPNKKNNNTTIVNDTLTGKQKNLNPLLPLEVDNCVGAQTSFNIRAGATYTYKIFCSNNASGTLLHTGNGQVPMGTYNYTTPNLMVNFPNINNNTCTNYFIQITTTSLTNASNTITAGFAMPACTTNNNNCYTINKTIIQNGKDYYNGEINCIDLATSFTYHAELACTGNCAAVSRVFSYDNQNAPILINSLTRTHNTNIVHRNFILPTFGIQAPSIIIEVSDANNPSCITYDTISVCTCIISDFKLEGGSVGQKPDGKPCYESVPTTIKYTETEIIAQEELFIKDANGNVIPNGHIINNITDATETTEDRSIALNLPTNLNPGKYTIELLVKGEKNNCHRKLEFEICDRPDACCANINAITATPTISVTQLNVPWLGNLTIGVLTVNLSSPLNVSNAAYQVLDVNINGTNTSLLAFTDAISINSGATMLPSAPTPANNVQILFWVPNVPASSINTLTLNGKLWLTQLHNGNTQTCPLTISANLRNNSKVANTLNKKQEAKIINQLKKLNIKK